MLFRARWSLISLSLSFSAFPLFFLSWSLLFYFLLFFSFLNHSPFQSLPPFYFSLFWSLYWLLCLTHQTTHVTHQRNRNGKVLSSRGQEWCSSLARLMNISIRFREQRAKSRPRKEGCRDKKLKVNGGRSQDDSVSPVSGTLSGTGDREKRQSQLNTLELSGKASKKWSEQKKASRSRLPRKYDIWIDSSRRPREEHVQRCGAVREMARLGST